MSAPERPDTVDDVVALFERYAEHRYDESVSQLAHALQTAALAAADGADDALVAAALLHDVGHLLEIAEQAGDDTPADVDLAHEARGAAWLSSLFGPEVTAPIALHVQAKRYRCAVDPGELDRLSAGSRRSLALQGGPMDADEVAAFEANAGFAAAVALRGWDDGGKVVGLEMPPLAAHRPLLARLAVRA